jgi:nucleoside-diphosphate-sugar epimerase
MNSRILLTGATGFVGRNLLKSFSKLGVEVDVIVRSGNKNKFSSSALISKIIETTNLFKHDRDWWASLCKDYSIVIHLAWYVEPGHHFDSNKNIECLIGSLSLIEGARKAGVNKFIGVGTCYEYDLLKKERVSAETSPLRPVTLYGASKLSLFTVLSQLFNTQENTFLWCRVFFLLPNKNDEIIYAENLRLGDYIKSRISKNEPVFLTSGTQIRDYLYVEDATDMMAKAILHNKTGAINICSGVPRTVRDVAEEIAIEMGKPELLNFGSKITQKNDPEYILGERDPFF